MNNRFSPSLLGLATLGLMAPAEAETAAGGGAAVASNTFDFTFNFKKKKPTELEAILSELEPSEQVRVRALFDEIREEQDDKANPGQKVSVLVAVKRKAESYKLELPDFLTALPALAQDIIKSFIADFVRAEFVDNFQQPGAHDWKTVEARVSELSKRGGGLSIDVSEEAWKAGAASFGQFITAKTNNAQVGARLEAAFKAKFTAVAISRYMNELNANILDKVAANLDLWAGWVAEKYPDDVEDNVKIYEYLTTRIKALKEKTVLDFAAIL